MPSPTLRVSKRGEAVSDLQKILNNVVEVDPRLVEDGIFGLATEKAVRKFQRDSGLPVDGIVGPITWRAITAMSERLNGASSRIFSPQSELADIARRYIGTTETDDNKAGNSQALLNIFKADDLVTAGGTDGYPWCASFVSFCVQELCRRSPFFGSLNPPREASVSRFLSEWAQSTNCLIFDNSSRTFKPRKGDIVVFVFSHIGIVDAVSGTTLTTIEGNTNEAGGREGTSVATKNRASSLIRKFIRIPVTTGHLNSQLREVSRLC
ncbi:peptidoglycan-binding protein [Marinimicrobium agarilyticum]|uniref:peptidoglycan-binding protein n=1 Tax=Marinimicrobium agarilyticum TaxID=306546 RepID=UPI000A038B97|nr:peptidoglycan-binding protein [Marinimicrobium agarilyticum]